MAVLYVNILACTCICRWAKLTSLPKPTVDRPDGVLVEIKAASVNPIDIRMAGEYAIILWILASEQTAPNFTNLLQKYG